MTESKYTDSSSGSSGSAVHTDAQHWPGDAAVEWRSYKLLKSLLRVHTYNPCIQEVSKFKVNVGQIQGSGQLELDNKNLSQ